jgi:hypothetical protein
MNKRVLSSEEAAKRWPRLLRACKWVAILTTNEASCMLRDWVRGFRLGGCEAVAHFGGPQRVLSEAIRVRHAVRRMR